jgi:preprotein translocase subunit SecB
VYSGVFRIQNCPEDMRRIVLMTEAPRYLFPFARRIISDVMRDGGMRPFLIDPIDFASLYREQVAGA